MIDINFYMKINDLKKRLMQGEKMEQALVREALEAARSPQPVVFNIETTNACNMRCQMCPRTTLMTRPIETLPRAVFEKIVAEMEPFTPEQWQKWQLFAQQNYGISPEEMSENHFFLYILPRVVILHGYGDPLLDKQIAKRVELLTAKGIPSYFSCNPANIDVAKSEALFASGLTYIKYSIESVDDQKHQDIRGQASNFSESYQKILKLLELKKKQGYQTEIVITMIDFDNSWQEHDYQKLQTAFADKDVYLYMKSLDQRWYTQSKEQKPTQSIHWTEFCQFPWSSLSIKSNGEVSTCGEDYNNETILGDTRTESLAAIWNGARYQKLRADHLALTPGVKCNGQCDMTLVGQLC